MSMMAAKQNDLIQAVDIHIIMIPSPGGPVPTPLPHPYLGKLDGGLSSDVKIDGMPAATVNSTSTNTPSHIPQGGPFQKPPTNQGKVMMGSATVFINGKPAARMGDMETCNDPADLPVGKIIVPFSTVLIGGPPSVAGSAASGSGGGGGGGAAGADAGARSGTGASGAAGGETTTDSSEGQEPEKSFVEFEVLDRVGEPKSDLKFELVLPGGEIKKGSLDSSGKVREDSIPIGNATLFLEGLNSARWASGRAGVGEEVEMLARGVALPEGCNVDFEVYLEGDEGEPLKTVQSTLSEGTATARYSYEYDEAHEGTTLELVFHAKAQGYFARSDALNVGQRLRGKFTSKDGGDAGIVHFTMKLSDGNERQGVSDNDGRFEVDGLPLGKTLIKPRFGGWIEQG